MKYLIIQGSSRSKGNTHKIIEIIKTRIDCDIIDLHQYNIGNFDYENKNKNDDFLELLDKIIKYDVLIFATPVYWFSMSSIMKTFLERLPIKKEFNKLKGKYMASISCGSGEDEIEGFFIPFRKGAEYLEMQYLGDIHTWVDKDNPSERVSELIYDFIESKIDTKN